ncbi:nucleotidyl transferase AbiEii/AbiGii toxin family protein [Bradyrhizobium sp. Ec3.3]|uniref:nucleotidyl transferase AbiEii/AbiGii toxin family protein n=1 Tax=Bradyrhizobium sp. Ec3.3 TaxID=189753 RepID=UPI000409B4E2|nr:nucleotidyl transferase AbiEii/AbiGii toxin family protein [Bradyrhizobium sp. Ec3.3]
MNDMPKIIQARTEDRRGLFQQTSQRLGCAPENVEKDFWVCWTLDVLYNKAPIKPRLLFKGGTSLSKAFDLIQRFSEDIDITVFRTDLLGEDFPSDDELRALGSKQRSRKLDEIKRRCGGFINGDFKSALTSVATRELEELQFKIEPDPDDPDGQSLLFHYPSAFRDSKDGYIRRVVKIRIGSEVGARSPRSKDHRSLFCNRRGGAKSCNPKRAHDQAATDIWDKIIILHGQRHWFQNRDELYKDGQRLSRHYYDVYRLLASEHGMSAMADLELAKSCADLARLYFDRKPLGLDLATPGTFGIAPPEGMLGPLKEDYDKMAGMIFGEIPPFEDIIERIAEAEATLNTRPKPGN